jgi:casein kinase II subunit beta
MPLCSVISFAGVLSQGTNQILQMILDVEPEEDDEDEEDDEEDEVDESGNEQGMGGQTSSSGRRRHGRTGADLSVVEQNAEVLYGLIHQRFICSRAGIQQMCEKYELGHFGSCPRTYCEHARTLPVGLSDVPGVNTVKLFCPSCLDVYVPPNSRFQTVDGAFFGRTFGALFLMTFPEFDLTKRGVETLTGATAPTGHHHHHHHPTIPRVPVSSQDLNGMYSQNIAPGLGQNKLYEPRIYGFRVSETARSGPRMQWLRSRPVDIMVLDEARRYAAMFPESDDEDDDVSMGGSNPNGREKRRRPSASTQTSQQPNQKRALDSAQGGAASPMTVDVQGVESEL